jgi:DNA-binding Lrp family transcriptional regulator
MDPLDVGILRELSRDQILWFGRLDPRISAADIARRLRVDRATVGSRLHAWERQGFLLSHEVVPSPLVFGAQIAGGNLRVDDIRTKPRILEDLALVPGLISAVDHVGEWVALLYAFEHREALERSRRLIERLPGVVEVTPCVPFRAPEPSMMPTRLDLRILDGLKTGSRRTLQEIARSIPVSTKSLSRRMEQLVQGRAVWYLPVFDFTRYGKSVIARFVIVLKPGADSHAVAREVSRQIPSFTHLTDSSSLAESPGTMPSLLDVGAHMETVGQVEDFERELRKSDAVEDVEVLFPRRCYLYRGWFDDHIRLALDRADRVPHVRGRTR